MKLELKQRIEMTKETIKTSMDSFLMDRLTKTYNELFLKEYIKNYLELCLREEQKKNLYLVVMHVDNITKINVKYSSKIGDETIVNLGYQIKQIQSEDDLLFKSKGPGYILLIHDFQGSSIRQYVSKFQTEVKRSEMFIEPISISAAVVALDEIKPDLTPETKANLLIAKASQRINYTVEMPDSAFLDRDTFIQKSALGKILVAESDPLALNIATSFFEKNQYQVTRASDGVLAVKYAREQLYDALIVDQYTFKQDGITVKQRINESSINMNTIFILTAQNKDVRIIDKANHVGIDYVVSKPIVFEEILGIIERNLKRKAGK